LQRFRRKLPPLELGVLISKVQAISFARNGMSLAEFAKGQKLRRLSSELIPSWVAARAVR
jgi:hypothetical protein